MRGKNEVDSKKGEVFGDLSWQCDEASISLEPVGTSVVFVVTCLTTTAEARESRETAIVLPAAKPAPATTRRLWLNSK